MLGLLQSNRTSHREPIPVSAILLSKLNGSSRKSQRFAEKEVGWSSSTEKNHGHRKRKSTRLYESITNGEAAEPHSLSSLSPTLSYPDCFRHAVQVDDTLEGIAIKYDVNPSDIKRLNGLWRKNDIHALQHLRIPCFMKQSETVTSVTPPNTTQPPEKPFNVAEYLKCLDIDLEQALSDFRNALRMEGVKNPLLQYTKGREFRDQVLQHPLPPLNASEATIVVCSTTDDELERAKPITTLFLEFLASLQRDSTGARIHRLGSAIISPLDRTKTLSDPLISHHSTE